jgi:hypothetical protein
VLFVDQFEEAFTILGADFRERFFALIQKIASVPGLIIIATMRSDYYAALQTVPMLITLKESGAVYDLAPPSEAEIAEIVEGPARLAGLRYERSAAGRDLADELVGAANQRGALPLLSFTLDRLFEQRDAATGLLRLSDYDDLGGLSGAIGRHADRVFANVEATGRVAEQHLRRVLRRLVREGGEGQLSGRPTPLDMFEPGSPERELIDAFVAARLFVVDEDRSPTQRPGTGEKS